jgi:hypothetical protein
MLKPEEGSMVKNGGPVFYCIAGMIAFLINCAHRSPAEPQPSYYSQWVTKFSDNFQGSYDQAFFIGDFNGTLSPWVWSDTSGGKLGFSDTVSKEEAIARGHVIGMTFLKGAETSEKLQISARLMFSSIDSNSAGIFLIDSAAKLKYLLSVGRDRAGGPAPGALTMECLSLNGVPAVISAAHALVPEMKENVYYQLELTIDNFSLQGKLLSMVSPIDSIRIGLVNAAQRTASPGLWAGIDLEGTGQLPLSAFAFTVFKYVPSYAWQWSATSAIQIDTVNSFPVKATGNAAGIITLNNKAIKWNLSTNMPVRISMDISLSSTITGAAGVSVFDSTINRRYWLIVGDNGIGQSASGALSLIITDGDTSRAVVDQARQSIQNLENNTDYRLVLTLDSSTVAGELQQSGSVIAKTQLKPGPVSESNFQLYFPAVDLSGTAQSPVHAGNFKVETLQKYSGDFGGSCPFIYSFDGASYVFDAEPYGGSICKGLKRTEWCVLDHLKEMYGIYELLMTNELDETQYTDELKLLAIDHPCSLFVAPDVSGKIHTFSRPLIPLSAVDRAGDNIAPLCSAKDGKRWTGSMTQFDPDGKAEPRDTLTFRFTKPVHAATAKLLINAGTTAWGAAMGKRFLAMYGSGVGNWYNEVDNGGPAYERIMNWYRNEELYMLKLQVFTRAGWKHRATVLGAGPVIAADRVYVIDLQDVPGDTLIIRMAPPAGFWTIDWVAADYTVDAIVAMHIIPPLHALNRAGNDVRGTLERIDNSCHIAEKGDSVRLVFPTPPSAKGLNRTIVLEANGYYKMHLKALGLPEFAQIAGIEKHGFSARFALKEYRKLERARMR